jgi:hypothetical protein
MPLLRSALTLDCDSVLCSTWRVKSTSSARSEIDAQEKFISFFKVGVLTRVMSGRDTASLETGAGAKAANNNVDDLSEVIRSLDKKAQGEYSLRLLLAARSQEQLAQHRPGCASHLRRCPSAGDGRDAWESVGLLCDVPRQSQVQCLPAVARGGPSRSALLCVRSAHRSSALGRPRQRVPQHLRDPYPDAVLSGRVCGRRAGHAHHRAYRVRQSVVGNQPPLRWSRNTAVLLTSSTSAAATRA